MNRILPTLIFVFSMTAFAQAQNGLSLEFRTVDGAPVEQPKMVYAAIHNVDPDVLISVEHDRLKVRSLVLAGPNDVVVVLDQHGLGQFVLVSDPTKRSHVGVESSDAPLPPDRGAYASDEEHAAAKQQWKEAHPEAHQLFLQELRAITPTSHE